MTSSSKPVWHTSARRWADSPLKPTLSLDDLRFFVEVASASTLAGAARALDVTPPAISQRLQQLEARLSLRLVDRSTRRLLVTEEGELLAEQARSMLAQMDSLQEALASRRGVVTGHLRIGASPGFGRHFVAPIVERFRRENPETTVDLVLSDSPLRQNKVACDLIVHLGRLHDSDLIAHKLASNERIACAAPSYVSRRGSPAIPMDLKDHECVVIRENYEDVTLWRFSSRDDNVCTVRIEPAMTSNDGDVVQAWALAGRGIILRSEWSVSEDIRAGRLVRVLTDWTLPESDVFALVRRGNRRTARSDRLLAMLREALAGPPWRAP